MPRKLSCTSFVPNSLSIPVGGDRTGRKNVSLVKTSFEILLPDNVISGCIVKSY